MASQADVDRRVSNVSGLSRRRFLSGSVVGLSGASFLGFPSLGAIAEAAAAELSSAPQTLVVGWASGPNGCDPEFNNAQGSQMIYRDCASVPMRFSATEVGKAFQDNFSDLILADASDLKVSDDWSKVTVTLKPGVISPTGNEMTADDVIYRSQRNWALRGVQWGFVKDAMLLTENSIVKENRYVYTVNMTGPNALAKIIQSHLHAMILDSIELRKHATSDDPWSTKWMAANFAGHGSWQLTENVPGDYWTIERNPNFYDKARYTGNVTKIIHKVIPASENRVALLESGAIDIAFSLQASELVRLRTTPGIRVDNLVGNYLQWLGFSFDTEAGKPLRDLDVRKAIAHVLPYDLLLQRPYLGLATQMRSTVAPAYAGYDRVSKIWNEHLDLAAAQALMAKSAYPNGFSTTLHYDIGQPGQEETAIIVKSALSGIKINAEIVKVQTGDFFNLAFTQGKGFPGLFVYRDFAGTPDVNFGTHLWLKSGHCCAPGGYHDAKIDALYKEAQGSPGDFDRRVDLQVQIDDIAINQDPMGVPMQALGYHVASRDNVGGFWWHPNNDMTWDKAWKA